MGYLRLGIKKFRNELKFVTFVKYFVLCCVFCISCFYFVYVEDLGFRGLSVVLMFINEM